MSRAYAPLLAPFKSTYPQYLVLLVLSEGEDLSVGALGRRLFLNSATLTPVLKRLEKAGFVRRQRGTQDEREVHLSLSTRGRALESEMRAIPEAVFCSTALSPNAVASLRTKLTQLAPQPHAPRRLNRLIQLPRDRASYGARRDIFQPSPARS